MAETRLELVRRCGADPIAYSTVQPAMRYFDTSFGYIAYRRIWGIDITLGPPVCDAKDSAAMVSRFLARSRRPIFCYVRRDFIDGLDASGLYCGGTGVDRIVDYDAFLNAPGKQVRSACKKAAKANFAVQQADFETLRAPVRQRLDEITRSYFDNARCATEVTFVNLPLTFEDDGFRRAFLLTKHDKEHDGPFGYAILNPIFSGGEVEGYLLDILRFERTRLWGVWLSAVWQLADLLSREGKYLSLGHSPLHGIEPAPAHLSTPWHDAQMRWMLRRFGTTDYLLHLRQLKTLVPGEEIPRYFASYSSALPVTFLALIRASGVTFSGLLGARLLRAVTSGMGGKKKR